MLSFKNIPQITSGVKENKKGTTMAEKQTADVSSVRSNPAVQLPRVVKNPLLSASVTGVTFDDFPNKPLLLPAAPPIVHITSVIPGPISSKEAESLVTVGHSSKLDNEKLDEINLNSSEDSTRGSTSLSDSNANLLSDFQNTTNTDSILSQAASSFSALPSVASNVFSTFSKRLYPGSRETTPTTISQAIPDFNANQIVANPSTSVLPPPPQFIAPPQTHNIPASGGFPNPGSFTSTEKETSSSQEHLPEPPKFYTPAEVPPLATVVPPPNSSGGQNNYRLSAKKKLYAPIPGLSDNVQITAPPLQQPYLPPPPNIDINSAPLPQPLNHYNQTTLSKLQEERKSGLFSFTNLVPSGVLQNISGFVQTATGKTEAKDTPVNSTNEPSYFGSTSENIPNSRNQYENTTLTNLFIQPSSAANNFSSHPGGDIGSSNLPQHLPTNFFNQPGSFAHHDQPISTGYNIKPESFYSAAGSVSLPPPPPLSDYQASTTASYPPPPPLINQPPPPRVHENPLSRPPFDLLPPQEHQSYSCGQPDIVSEPNPPAENPVTVFDLTRKTTNNVDLLRQATSTSSTCPDDSTDQIHSQLNHLTPQAAILATSLSNNDNPTESSQSAGSFISEPQAEPAVQYPYQQGPPAQNIQVPEAPNQIFNPHAHSGSQTKSTLPPPAVGGNTSFRLQKGTRLYKSPLTTQETAPLKVKQVLDSNVTYQPHTYPTAEPSLVNSFLPPQSVNQSGNIQNFFNPVANTNQQIPSAPIDSTAPNSVSLLTPSVGNLQATPNAEPLHSTSTFANNFFVPPTDLEKSDSTQPSQESEANLSHPNISPYTQQPISGVENNSFRYNSVVTNPYLEPSPAVVQQLNLFTPTEVQDLSQPQVPGETSESQTSENQQNLFTTTSPAPVVAPPVQKYSPTRPEEPQETHNAVLGGSVQAKPQEHEPAKPEIGTLEAAFKDHLNLNQRTVFEGVSEEGNLPVPRNPESLITHQAENSELNTSTELEVKEKLAEKLTEETRSQFAEIQKLADLPEEPHLAQAPPQFPPQNSSNLNKSNPYRKVASTEPKSTVHPKSGPPTLLSDFFCPSTLDSNSFPGSHFEEFSSAPADLIKPTETSSQNQQKEESVNFFNIPTKPVEISNVHIGEAIINTANHFFNQPANSSSFSGEALHIANRHQTSVTPIGFDSINSSVESKCKNASEKLIETPSNSNPNTFNNFFNPLAKLTSLENSRQSNLLNNPNSFFDDFTEKRTNLIFPPSTADSSQDSGNLPKIVQSFQEQQNIENFFNNPPPKENIPQGAGDLNYDLVHSGVAVKNLQARCLTPGSNIVEPPSSACSEFSELNNSSASSNKNFSAVASTAPLVSDTPDSAKSTRTLTEKAVASSGFEQSLVELRKHYEEVPEEILQLFKMSSNNESDQPSNPDTVYSAAAKHWFYKKDMNGKAVWLPFSYYDSSLIERTYILGESSPKLVAVEGGRFDVNIKDRTKIPVFWEGKACEVKRCSWFYKGLDSKYIPYEEDIADFLEQEYKQTQLSGEWHKKIMLSMGEYVVFHGPTVLVHFKQQSDIDSWSSTSPSATRPRVVKRDLEDFNIPPAESQRVDHLLFMVHGIGSVCDLRMRPIDEVVDDFRNIAHQLVQSHYKNSTEEGVVGRVEVLPISWHSQLHSPDLGIDEKLKAITLESIPMLRNFTNDTLLDILFYTSPVYCQRIMNSIASSLNSVYVKYRERNPEFNGSVSLAGHSLGSIILFDLLCHQQPLKETEDQNQENPDLRFFPSSNDSENKVVSAATKAPMSYVTGHAGTGQPFIEYGQLVFQPKRLFALGSPIGMFVTIRGIDKLGLDFRLPTCPSFYNIFHPFDPVAYRIEALVNPDMAGIKPVLIPHHKGRKRMHLELKETVARVGVDLKQKFMDTFKNTLESVSFLAGSTRSRKETDETIQKEVDQALDQFEEQEKLDLPSPNKCQEISKSSTAVRERTSSVSTTMSDSDLVEIDFPLGKLNDSKRIDYVLQEAPLEFFNEYLFALRSHVCYWESEDTILFVMKEIYNGLGVSPDSQVPQQTMTIERPPQKENISN